MANIVTIFLTRHAESTSNYVADNHIANFDSENIQNPSISAKGLEDIIYWRKDKLKKIGHVDFIFTSPLQLCLETCLLTENVSFLNQPIYVSSLLTEFGETPQTEGQKINDIKRNVDLVSYNNFKQLDFDQFFWRDNRHINTGIWWNVEFRMDLYRRIADFMNMMRDGMFSGKTVHIYSHGGVIENIIKSGGVHNYQTVKITFNQETGHITCLNFRI